MFRGSAGRGHLPGLLSLDTRSAAGSLLPREPYLSAKDLAIDGALLTPGADLAIVVDGDEFQPYDQRVIVYGVGARKPLGTAFASGCGSVASVALDSSGRHLLVGTHSDVAECGNASPDRLIRVDLPAGLDGVKVVPARYPGDLPDLRLPQRAVWHGERPVSGLAW
ncbi:hypothetical protein [Planotetraspora sp. GP83]|uniref:hypothetical protein n=1 Tax=Planotetraspora sp. GP83 TaxID=3156264 RepID=UPI003516886C